MSSHGDLHFRYDLSLLVGVGTETPLNPHNTPAIFTLTQEARDRYQISDPGCATLSGCTYQYVALVPPDRHRFLNHLDAGLRLMTHHFDCPQDHPACTAPGEVNFPGLIDVRVGPDAAITGGSFGRPVIKVSAFYPLPVEGLGRTVYVFGGFGVSLQKESNQQPLFLTAADASVTLPNATVYTHVLSAPEMDRDVWKIGIAFDLISLAKGFKNSSTPPASTPAKN